MTKIGVLVKIIYNSKRGIQVTVTKLNRLYQNSILIQPIGV